MTEQGNIILRLSATVSTTDATVTTCGTVSPTDESTTFIRAVVIGRATGANTVAYELSAAANRETGTLALVTGAPSQDHVYENTAAPSFAGCDATIDVSGNDIRIRVTGLAATTINWKAFIEAFTYAI